MRRRFLAAFMLTPRSTRLPVSFYAQALLCAALWGSAFPVIKHSYAALEVEGLDEQLLFAGVRFLIAGLLVMALARRAIWPTLTSAPKGQMLGMLLGQTFGQYIFFYYALSVSSGALGALLGSAGSFWWVLLGSAGSFWWVLLAPAFLKTPWPTRKHWLSLASCSLGIGLAVYAPGAGSGQVAVGAACFLAASLCGSIGALFLKQLAPAHGSRAMTSLSLFGGGALLALCGLSGWDGFWSGFSWSGAAITLYLAALSATAFTIWNRLIERYSVNLLSSFRFLIPLFGVIESVLFIPGEALGLGIVAGGAIVLLSLFLLGRSESAPAIVTR